MGCDSEGCSCGESKTPLRRKIIRLSNPEVRIKGWGFETIIHNGNDYCGKILNFNEGGRFSMHYHVKKRETWYVAKGIFNLRIIDPDTAEENEMILQVGDVVEIEPGLSHQLFSEVGGQIFEVSTPDDVKDSYRIRKGDSQLEGFKRSMI